MALDSVSQETLLLQKKKKNQTSYGRSCLSLPLSPPPPQFLNGVLKWFAREMMVISQLGAWRFHTKQLIPSRQSELKVTPHKAKVNGVCMTK